MSTSKLYKPCVLCLVKQHQHLGPIKLTQLPPPTQEQVIAQIRKSELDMQQVQQLHAVAPVMQQQQQQQQQQQNISEAHIIAQLEQLRMKKEQLRQEQEEVQRRVRHEPVTSLTTITS